MMTRGKKKKKMHSQDMYKLMMLVYEPETLPHELKELNCQCHNNLISLWI